VFPGLALSDAGIAIAAALVLFMLPSGDGGRLLDWPTAATLRWDVLILFGGGLALATILETSGLAAWLAGTVDAFSALPILLLLGLIAAMIVYVGELASNTAMAAIFLPIAGAIAMSLGAEPVQFMLPLAFAASVGFMLPVATPPNAIVFSHETVTRGNMLRAGAPLDVIGILVAVGLGYLMAPIVFG
jgi:sodium-dependent dicarboxylate transporter 2/3/5